MKHENRPDILEDISAFMDDELPPDEGGALVDRMSKDETLRRRWSHYHLIGDTLRGLDCRVQTALDDEDSLSARIAEEIEGIEEDECSNVETDASRPLCRDTVASPPPIHPRRRSAHSHSSTPSEPEAPSASGSCDRSPKTHPSKPSRSRFFAGHVLTASIAVIAISGVVMILSSEKKVLHEETSSASMDLPSVMGSEARQSEEMIAPVTVFSDRSLTVRTAVQDSGYRNLYLLRRGYQGGELRAMQGYSRIVGDQTLAH